MPLNTEFDRMQMLIIGRSTGKTDMVNRSLVENQRLRFALRKCLEWFYKLPMREQWDLYAEVSGLVEIAREALGETDYPLGE
jgi:hypothetical protein